MAIKHEYQLRFCILPPIGIFNWLAQRNVTAWFTLPELHDTWWESDTVAIRWKFEQIWIDTFDEETQHFTKLEQSILDKGFLHPIRLHTGVPFDKMMVERLPKQTLPPNLQDNKRVLVPQQFGGSRLTLAMRHNLHVPCVIWDFDDAYPEWGTITEREMQEMFKDGYRPYTYPSGVSSMVIQDMVHLEGTKYTKFNAHKKIQEKASTIARKGVGFD